MNASVPKLRPYQERAVNEIYAAWEKYDRVCLQMPTGGGKTNVFSHIISEYNPGPDRKVLAVAHRKELIQQMHYRLGTFGVANWTVYGGKLKNPIFPVQCGSVQTLRKQKPHDWPGDVELIVLDECFPSGTLIDGKPIESYQIGDWVTAYNEKTGEATPKRVVRLFKNPAKQLVKVHLSDGRSMVCTPGHPFLTPQGWEIAANLEGMTVYELRDLRESNISETENLFNRVPFQGFQFDDGKNQSDLRFGADVQQQSNGTTRMPAKNVGNLEKDATQASSSGWQWSSSFATATNVTGCTGGGMAVRVYCSDPSGKDAWASHAKSLQTGYCQSEAEDCGRGGWQFALHSEASGSGHSQGKGLNVLGVASVEVFQCSNSPEFAALCPDGYVYNLEVEDWHTYTVDGVIVHNCHHVTKNSGYDVILQQYPKAKVLGVTATPCRLDGKGLDYAFEHLVLGPTVQSLIDQGHLSPFRAFKGMCPDLSDQKVRHGDYQVHELADTMSDTLLLGDLVRAYKELADGLQTIVFAVNIEHSMSIVRRYRESGIEAEHIDGSTPDLQRAAILRRFKDGQTKVLSNVGIVTEGFDVPACSCVQLARPTKSLSLYLQMVGRALRPHPGKTAIILDHGSNIEEHGLPTDGHEWTLQSVKKRKRAIEIDPATQEIKVIEEDAEKKEVLEVKDAEMVEVGQTYQDRIKDICITAEINGYQKGWAYYRTLELFQSDLKLDHLKFLASQLGYHWRWAVHRYEEWQSQQKQRLEEMYGIDW